MAHFLNIHEMYLGYNILLDGERYRTPVKQCVAGVNEIPAVMRHHLLTQHLARSHR
jgi:hypothetical protein